MNANIYCVQNVHNSTVVGRGRGDVYGVCRIFFLVFSIFYIQKSVQIIIDIKLKHQKLVLCNNVKTYYFLQKEFCDNLQNVFKASDLAASEPHEETYENLQKQKNEFCVQCWSTENVLNKTNLTN